jgi:hypothetical protein
MKMSSITLAALATTMLVPLAFQTASAADTSKPMFAVLPMHGAGRHYAHQPSSLQLWSGSFTYQGKTNNYQMVGTSPFTTNTTTTINVFLIPVKMIYGKKIYGAKFIADPMKDQQNGVSIIQNLLNSPLFNSLDFQWGPTDVGSTQYEDAYQRGSFWGSVGSTNTSYHVVFATPTVLTEQKIKVTKAQGGALATEFGVKVGLMNINSFDSFIHTTISKFSQINPTNFPVFVTDNVYLTSGGCCIGGYHSAESNGQTYSMATYIPKAGVFSQDIGAFSHEFGEWYADPLTNNGGCGGLLEVGDPLEGKTNYGDFNVVFNGVTWHPQALVFLSYFGAPLNTGANSWYDNQNIETSACENGQ